jgi:putative transposase
MANDIQYCVRTLRLRVKREGYAWLNAAAIEVNQVWNYANATSYKAARPFAGAGKWLSAFDLDKLTAGATECFEHIGSGTIQRVKAEFATRRRQFKRAKLRWRVSQGSKRSLGWVPFKAVQLKRKGRSLRFSGKVFRVFERELLEGVSRRNCSTRASRPAGAFSSSVRETQREHAAAAKPSRALQAWTYSL